MTKKEPRCANSETPRSLDLIIHPLPMQPSPSIEWDQVMATLDCLGKKPEDTYLRAIRPKEGSQRGPAVPFLLDGTTRAEHFVRRGWGLYFNVGNGGTSKDQISSVPAFWMEWDDIPVLDQINLWLDLQLPEPSLQIDSAGKSVHTYWVLQKPISPDRWEPIQRRLIDYGKADKAVKDCSRVLRLPGVLRTNGQGQCKRTQILTLNSNRYSPEEIEDCLPIPKPSQLPRLPYRPSTRCLELDRVLDALAQIPRRRGRKSESYPDYRNLAWSLKAALHECGQPDPEAAAIQLMEAHSPSRECGWDVAQVMRSGGEQVGPGTLFHQAKQYGWRPKRHA